MLVSMLQSLNIDGFLKNMLIFICLSLQLSVFLEISLEGSQS